MAAGAKRFFFFFLLRGKKLKLEKKIHFPLANWKKDHFYSVLKAESLFGAWEILQFPENRLKATTRCKVYSQQLLILNLITLFIFSFSFHLIWFESCRTTFIL